MLLYIYSSSLKQRIKVAHGVQDGDIPPPRGTKSLKEEPKGEGPCGAVGWEGVTLGGDILIRQYYNFLICIN